MQGMSVPNFAACNWNASSSLSPGVSSLSNKYSLQFHSNIQMETEIIKLWKVCGWMSLHGTIQIDVYHYCCYYYYHHFRLYQHYLLLKSILLFRDFTRSRRSRISGCWYQCSNPHHWTWYGDAGTVAKEINHIFVSTRWRILQNCKVYWTAEFCGTDLRLVVAILRLHFKTPRHSNVYPRVFHLDRMKVTTLLGGSLQLSLIDSQYLQTWKIL